MVKLSADTLTEKKLAVEKACEYVLDKIYSGEVRSLGIGSGSTVCLFLKNLRENLDEKSLEMITVVTASYQTYLKGMSLEFNVTMLPKLDSIDLTVDGADEVSLNKDLIKGGGAALTREKILAYNSREVIIVVDSSKLSSKLGVLKPIPVEVIPCALPFVLKSLKALGATPKLREAQMKNGPIITDNGNFIVDAKFKSIPDAEQLENSINMIPGVIENGIFPGKRISKVFIGEGKRVKIL